MCVSVCSLVSGSGGTHWPCVCLCVVLCQDSLAMCVSVCSLVSGSGGTH